MFGGTLEFGVKVTPERKLRPRNIFPGKLTNVGREFRKMGSIYRACPKNPASH
jgi:hypothetical protein